MYLLLGRNREPCSYVMGVAAVSGEDQNVMSVYCWHVAPTPSRSVLAAQRITLHAQRIFAGIPTLSLAPQIVKLLEIKQYFIRCHGKYLKQKFSLFFFLLNSKVLNRNFSITKYLVLWCCESLKIWECYLTEYNGINYRM